MSSPPEWNICDGCIEFGMAIDKGDVKLGMECCGTMPIEFGSKYICPSSGIGCGVDTTD